MNEGAIAAASPAPLYNYFITAKGYGNEVILARVIKARSMDEASSNAKLMLVAACLATPEDLALGRARLTHIAEQ